MTNPIDISLAQQAASLFAEAHRVVVLTHVGPDGDAMGSALAMYHHLSSAERQVTVIVPNEFPAFLGWLPAADKVLVYEKNAEACNAAIANADLFVCTDFNDPKRIHAAGEKMMENTAPKVLIDHHLNPVDFANVMFSDPQASSACEIVYRLLSAIGPIQSHDVAVCLYTGLMTDTGNFSFNSNNPDLYEIVAQLLRLGVNKDAVYNAVFNQYSSDCMRLTGFALYRKMRIFPEYHLALITLSADELDQYHYKAGDTEGLVNMPLQIADVYYSVYMREERPKPGTPRPRIRVSFRSQGDRPVNIWASEVFHGGGHMNASGGEMFGTINQAVQLFEQSYPKYVKKD